MQFSVGFPPSRVCDVCGGGGKCIFDNTFILAKIMTKVEILWEAARKRFEGINIILQMLLPFSFSTYFGDVVSRVR